jgi:predicted PurR-regulated permease PerM
MTPTDGYRGGPAPSATAVIIGVGVLLLMYQVRLALLPFVLAGIPAYLCGPLITRLTARTGAPRWLFALTAWVVLAGFGSLIGYFGARAFTREWSQIGVDLEGNLAHFVHDLLGGRQVPLPGGAADSAQIAAYAIGAASGWVRENGHMLLLSAWGFTSFFGFILLWVLLGYFLLEGRQIARGALWVVPPSYRPLALEIWTRVDPMLRRYFLGVGIVLIYTTLAAYLGLGLVLGLHHAIFLALLTGVLEVIPVIGPGAAAVIAGLAATQQAQGPWNILAYVLYAIALRVSIDQFFGPIVLGRAAHLPPVLIIFCFLSGGMLLGIVGVILAVPVALGVKVALATLYGEPRAQG